MATPIAYASGWYGPSAMHLKTVRRCDQCAWNFNRGYDTVLAKLH